MGSKDEKADWIWTPESDDEPNLHLRFRRVFTLNASGSTGDRQGRIAICADSRYVLYVNGNRIGEGPAKSFSWRMMLDSYDVSRYLQDGENVVGVSVTRFGLTSGRYDGGRGGLWCRVDTGNSVLNSDEQWRVTPDISRARHVRRMAYSMEFTDVHDLRMEDGWAAPGYVETDVWLPAVRHLPAPNVELVSREIPHLSRTNHHPVTIVESRAVRVPAVRLALDLLSRTRAAGISDEETGEIGGYFVTRIIAETDGTVAMERMNPSFDLDTFGPMKANGREVEFDHYGNAAIQIVAGENLVVVRIDRRGQSFPSWVLTSDVKFHLDAPAPFAGSPLAAAISPSQIIPELFERADLKTFESCVDQFSAIREDEILEDSFARVWGAVPVSDSTVNVTNAGSMLDASLECAEIALQGTGDAELLLDFGEETVGYLGFSIHAAEGTIVEMVGFEAFVEGERLRTDNLNNTVCVTLDEGWNEYLSANRLGLRYLLVTIRSSNWPVKIRGIHLLRAVYPVNRTGSFFCSDPALGAIWDLGRRTVELCMDDTYVDCPAYEAAFWIGDMRTEALAARSAFGETRLTLHCLELGADSLKRSDLVECVVPSGNHRIIPNWSLLWSVTVWEYLSWTGDTEGISRLWPSIEQQTKTIASHVEERGLFRFTDWNMMDWASLDTPVGCYPATESGWAVRALEVGAEIASLLKVDGAERLAEQWQETARQVRTAINQHLWSEEEGAYRDSVYPDGTPGTGFSQQTQIVLLITGCVPKDRTGRIGRAIIAAPEGWTEVASPWMMWFRFEALAMLGEHELILDTTRDYWGAMMRLGATTCWETFSGYFEGRWSPTRSWCHGWSSAPVHFLSRYQLGVHQVDPSGERVIVEPNPCGLTWARGSVPTRQGTVDVDWRIENGVFSVDVVHPHGVSIDVRVPNGTRRGECVVSARKATSL